jgi:protein involved in polysaccharide export with SLBB domain
MKALNILFGGIILLLSVSCSSPKPQSQDIPTEERFICVDGEVNERGRFAWTNGMTLQNAIDDAGGLTAFAPLTLRVRHINGSAERYRLDSKMYLIGNVPVKPGDQIFSPRPAEF